MIKNSDLPSCRNCIHFKPSFFTPEFDSSISKCANFGRKDVITDKVSYDYADLCRDDEKKCGLQGKYFEEDPNIVLKVLTHSLLSNSPYILAISSIILAAVLVIE